MQAVRSSMNGLLRDRPSRAPGSRSRSTVELHVSVQQGVAFQMDHHPLEVALPFCVRVLGRLPLEWRVRMLQSCLFASSLLAYLHCSRPNTHHLIVTFDACVNMRHIECFQAWLAKRAGALRSTALEQRLWARTLPSVGGSAPLDEARESLYRDLARGYRDRCLQVRLRLMLDASMHDMPPVVQARATDLFVMCKRQHECCCHAEQAFSLDSNACCGC